MIRGVAAATVFMMHLCLAYRLAVHLMLSLNLDLIPPRTQELQQLPRFVMLSWRRIWPQLRTFNHSCQCYKPFYIPNISRLSALATRRFLSSRKYMLSWPCPPHLQTLSCWVLRSWMRSMMLKRSSHASTQLQRVGPISANGITMAVLAAVVMRVPPSIHRPNWKNIGQIKGKGCIIKAVVVNANLPIHTDDIRRLDSLMITAPLVMVFKARPTLPAKHPRMVRSYCHDPGWHLPTVST